MRVVKAVQPTPGLVPLGDSYVKFEGSVAAEVQQASDVCAVAFQFRFRVKNEEDTYNAFLGTDHILRPELDVTYTLK
jgi:hypothetical protein